MTKAAKEKPLTNRQKLMVDYLPTYNWDKTKAAIAAGFSRNYAETSLHTVINRNHSLAKAIEAKRAEISSGTQDKREEAERILWGIAKNPKSSQSTVIKALSQVAKMNGWESTTLNLESDQRQKRLDARMEAEVQSMLDERYGIKSVDCRQIGGIVADNGVAGLVGAPDGDNEADVMESDNGI